MQRASLNFVFINGKNGAGKDTQAKYLLELVPNSIGLSTGDIYRSAKSKEGEFAKYNPLVTPYIDLIDNHGGLLPDEVITDVVKQVVTEKAGLGITTFVFSGFPRTIPQLTATDVMLNKLSEEFDVRFTYVGLAVLDEQTFRRTEIRRTSAIAANEKPREDDEPSIVNKRLQTYRKLTEPMLHLLAKEKRLVVIKGNGSKEDLYRRTVELQECLIGATKERE